MKESIENVIHIEDHIIIEDWYVTEYILEWIYTGESDLPKDVFQLIDILNISDEYLL